MRGELGLPLGRERWHLLCPEHLQGWQEIRQRDRQGLRRYPVCPLWVHHAVQAELRLHEAARNTPPVLRSGLPRCGIARCGDGKQDGDETDVDCGGACAPCSQGMKCLQKSDCATDLECDPSTRRCVSSWGLAIGLPRTPMPATPARTPP